MPLSSETSHILKLDKKDFFPICRAFQVIFGTVIDVHLLSPSTLHSIIF